MSEIKDCSSCKLNGTDCFKVVGRCGERYDKWQPKLKEDDMGIRLPPDFGKDEGSENITASKFGRQFEALAHHGESVKEVMPLILTNEFGDEWYLTGCQHQYRLGDAYAQGTVAQRDADRLSVIKELKEILHLTPEEMPKYIQEFIDKLAK